MPTDFWGGIVWSVAPTIVIGLLFWFIMRSLIRSDRNERKAYSKIEAEERARFAASSPTSAPDAASPGAR